MAALLILVIVAALLALGYAAFNFIGVKKLDEGTDRMSEIAEAIRVGANAFITYEYKIIGIVVVIIAIILQQFFSPVWKIQLGAISMFHHRSCDECISRMGRNEDCNLCKCQSI